MRAAGDPALAGRHVRSRARRLLGRPRRDRSGPCAGDGRLRRRDRRATRRRSTASRSRCSTTRKEIALRARLPAGVRMYTGDDFNFAALIGGDARRPFRRAARHLRRDRAGGLRRADRARARRPRAIRRDPRADGAAVAPHLRGADALLQDRRRVHGVAQRPPVAFHDGRRPAERAQPRASRRALPARRCRGAAARSRRSRPRACARCSPCTASTADRPMRRASADERARSRPAVDQHGDRARAVEAAGDHRRLRAARHPRHLAVARPGRRGRARRHGAAHPRRRPHASPASAAAACFRRPIATAGAPRSTTTAAPSTRRCALGARCLVLVVGGLPKDRGGAIVSKDLAGAREMVRDGIGELLDYARAAGMPLAIEPLHPMYAADRACVNTLAHANDALRRARARRRDGLGVAVDVYHVWWDPRAAGARSSAPAQREPPASRITSATGWCRPPTC